MTDPEEKSILKGVNDLIDSELGLTDIGKAPHHKHKTSCDRLTKAPMTGFDASVLIAGIYEQVRTNWDAFPKYHEDHEGSKQNWRLITQPDSHDSNRNPEVVIEKAIVNIPVEIWPDAEKWFNQVPVASGLVDPHEGGRRIDLVHDCGNKTYELIELKVYSDTPLYAAMEILKYGVLYIFCRQDDRVKCVDRKGELIIDREGKLMQAKKIHLRVLAPPKYYKRYDLSWLETSINSGLDIFRAKLEFEFEMDFKFETLWLIPSHSPVTWKASA